MKSFWEKRYAEEDFAYGIHPNAFLVEQVAHLPAGGRVLVAGDGEGRNGVWLARHGFIVTSVDYAQSGLDKARRLAAEQGVVIDTCCADLTAWRGPSAAFDAVVSIFVHFPPAVRREVHRSLFESLRPGGLLLLEAFSPEQLRYSSGGPSSVDLLYTAWQLEEDFTEGEFLLLQETLTELDEGACHQGPAAVTRALIRKP
ncbi:MAG: class I SAM-dependent methyltransferase [Halothiobacillaceae bacterium]|nr:class I SAM-dependent methyltransferase [Halothiobacillaceae bacterium]